jgi:hypothetical protein
MYPNLPKMSNSNSWRMRAERRAAWGRRLARARWASPVVKDVDADTARWRALDDARGKVLREGVTYRGDGTVTAWAVRRSVAGRTDQVDVVADGQVVNRMGRTRLGRVLPGGCPG